MTKRKSKWARLGAPIALVVAASAIAVLPAGATGGTTSAELTVVGQADAAELGVIFENVTDVWAAQSSSDGGDYAYLGSFDDVICSLDTTGVNIVDITDPTDPTKVAFIPAKPGTRNNDVKVEHIETSAFTGEILVVSNEGCGAPFIPRLKSNGGAFLSGQGGVAIWDVTDPTKPKALKQNFLKFDVHNTFIWQDGDNAYMIVIDDENVQDIHIVDITKPQSPKEITVTGQLDWPENDNIGDGEVFAHDVWVQDGIAYLSYWDAGLVMLDVSDPYNPVFMGDSEYEATDPFTGLATEGNSHVAVPNAAGDIVLMGDEDFSGSSLVFSFDGTEYPAAEGIFSAPISSNPMNGPIHWTGGNGCTVGDFDRAANPGEIALIQRGVCFFSQKASSAEALGYAGFIVANDAARGDALINMSAGTPGPFNIPGVFVWNSTGETMKANEGGIAVASSVFDGFGYLRSLDVSDPTNIVELGQFATENVFTEGFAGDTTMHNIVVDGGTTAYISWYAEGMRVVDFSDPANLVETAHYIDPTGSNFWGVYLYEHSNGETYILGSDRSTGLWIFETP